MVRIVRQSGKLRKNNVNSSRQTRRLHMGHFYLALLIIIVFVTQTLLQPKKDVLKNSLPTQSSSLHKVAPIKEKQEEPNNNNNNLDAKSDNILDTVKTSDNSETAEPSETSNNSENSEDPKNPTVEEEEEEEVEVEVEVEVEGVSQEEIPSNKEPSTDTIDVVENKDNENEASPNENGSSLINVDESTSNETETGTEKVPDVENTKPAPIHSLRCDESLGPDNLKATKEMAYWSDIPSDATFVSPFKREGVEQYVTFEPDAGAFNNMRMAWENIVVFALATGRTLVLLPERIFPYITDGAKGQKHKFTFNDFYHIQEIREEHPGLNIITMTEFLEKVVKEDKYLPTPPDERFNWDDTHLDPLFQYLRQNAYGEEWIPTKCVCVIPAGTNSTSVIDVAQKVIASDRVGRSQYESYVGNPTPVDDTVEERFREMQDGRKELCVYNEKMQEAPIIHFKMINKNYERLLLPFQSFYFFEDWKQDLRVKRFVRDHMRYRDEIMCAAARVIEGIRTLAKVHEQKRLNAADDNNTVEVSSKFHTAHIRRGDFSIMYKNTQISADAYLNRFENYFEEGSFVYILTDEKDDAFFAPLKEKYNICFLKDFSHLLKGVNTNLYGMIEQLIAAKGEIFIGTYLSTFSAHINRLRGYYSTKNQLEGYKEGTLQSYYFTRPHDIMRKYNPIHGPYWGHEFPVGWRDIDKDVEVNS